MKNLIYDLSFELALNVLNFSLKLKENRHFEISSQLLRSGTSVGANIREAQTPASRKDFIYKMNLALKEAEETRYWLQLLSKSDLQIDTSELQMQATSVVKVLAKIVSSAKANG